MNTIYELNEWSVVTKYSKYTFLSLSNDKIYLKGKCPLRKKLIGSSNLYTELMTTSIVKIEGDLIYTKSGSIYKLKNPSEEYSIFLLNHLKQ